ncbi:methylated-DNA--protein-cysteine methyltransferase KNAG_0A02460 [Huiozyma naganishii CBS 8797]|uniref:Methylated-DNA--protein-cysteine methyltransferase n=1 Tax=Huiozyma naganishii (strain ATCC MYA-139 / BCRC 22969 / CBS 8797 / KCTC 17520 / NBRC 10181 / NCYC 3082 / Yp74L-3) TaxID=1071383 RepID=J7QZM0_HUIN7|nr:hypothetical protein KNAG_0A02460 [Kazachstania naganishii CBS 8797]CCK67935.1 hypothetical protein KNAG_0A02460 [Kazachstania naganishii CBS 8797]
MTVAKGDTFRYFFVRGRITSAVAASRKSDGKLVYAALGDDESQLLQHLHEDFKKLYRRLDRAFELTEAEDGEDAGSGVLTEQYKQWLDGTAWPAIRHDLIFGTPFQHTVWAQMLKLHRGQTTTYSALAKGIGRPTASRAVASACKANEIALIVPCHMVLNSKLGISGYKWGGPVLKRKLIARETQPHGM